MPTRIPPFRDEENALILRLYASKAKDWEIAAALNQLPCNEHRRRSSSSVKYQRLALGCRPARKDQMLHARRVFMARQEVERVDAIKGDRAFKKAMLKAIHAGLETAPIGVFKDRRPVSLRLYRPEPDLSGVASPANMCAELGSRPHAA